MNAIQKSKNSINKIISLFGSLLIPYRYNFKNYYYNLKIIIIKL